MQNSGQMTFIKPGERVDDLQVGGLKIIQNPKWFCFGIDAVLLSAFTQVKAQSLVVDIGTGTGIIPLLLTQKNETLRVVAYEIQADVADMAQRSVTMNGLEARIAIRQDDMLTAAVQLGKGVCDVVVSNPPYMETGEGLKNLTPHKAISRHELMMTLDGLFQTAHDLLKPGASFYMIHRPSRMVDIFSVARACRMEPKAVQFIHPKKGKAPNLMLFRFTKHGRKELRVLDPLYVYEDNGDYTEAIYDIYRKAKIDVFE